MLILIYSGSQRGSPKTAAAGQLMAVQIEETKDE
jgi:hypothetical protein